MPLRALTLPIACLITLASCPDFPAHLLLTDQGADLPQPTILLLSKTLASREDFRVWLRPTGSAGDLHTDAPTDGAVDAPVDSLADFSADAPGDGATDIPFPDASSDGATDIPFPDASSDGPAADLAGCPTACTGGCGGGVCAIDCSAGSGCYSAISCPDGLPCVVSCGSASCTQRIICGSGPCTVSCGDNACAKVIDCSSASSCDVDCGGTQACSGNVSCGSGPCTVTCGPDSCDHVVDCQTSCACSVDCVGPNACAGGVVCPAGCSGCTPADSCDLCP